MNTLSILGISAVIALIGILAYFGFGTKGTKAKNTTPAPSIKNKEIPTKKDIEV